MDKTYTIGGKMVRWMSSARNDQQLIHLAGPHLEKLAHQTRESSHLGVLTGTRVTLIDVVPPDALVAIKHSVGSTVELYCSAIGKALLAFLPAELQDRIIEEIEFRRFTASTIMEPAAFREDLVNVRRLGYAIDDAEFNDWIYCIAAPILDHRNHAVASLGLSVFKPTLDAEAQRLALLRAEVCDCASAVSQELGKVVQAYAKHQYCLSRHRCAHGQCKHELHPDAGSAELICHCAKEQRSHTAAIAMAPRCWTMPARSRPLTSRNHGAAQRPCRRPQRAYPKGGDAPISTQDITSAILMAGGHGELARSAVNAKGTREPCLPAQQGEGDQERHRQGRALGS